MNTEFQFFGFTPTDLIKAESSRVVSHIREIAPNITHITAKLEYLGNNYICILDVALKRGASYSVVNDQNPASALQKAEKSMISKLSRQKETRFYSRNNLDELG